MDGFLKRFQKGKGDKKDSNKNTPPKNNNNPNPLQQFQNIFQPNKQQQNETNSNNYRGGGVALGTANKLPPGSKIVEIELKQSLETAEETVGIFVEQNEKNSAIVSKVIRNSAGDKAGFIRGDVICFPGSDGMEEMHYDQFIVMLKERNMHSLHFEVRRVVEKNSKASNNNNANANSSNMSADAYVKRQAVIAAAEKRKKKNNPKPIKHITATTKESKLKSNNNNVNYANAALNEAQPMSEQSKKAVEAAKASEARDVQNLGFNPYEACSTTAGQAKKTVNDVIHGQINTTTNTGETTTTPSNAITTNLAGNNNHILSQQPPPSIHESFDIAFSTYASSNDNTIISTSLSIITKLITNALTKTDDKFKRVRLSNPKIQSNIVNTQGAMDIMMAFGFVLLEEDNEMWLIYNDDCGYDNGVQDQESDIWKIQALEYMKQCL